MLEKVARKLRRPLVFIECGPDDKPSPHVDLERLRQLCPSVRFLRLGGEKPVSEEAKRNALAAADVGISLVDNAQETFRLGCGRGHGSRFANGGFRLERLPRSCS